MKAKLIYTAIGFALCASSALASTTSPNKQGSLIIIPGVTVEAGKDTMIEISNDQNSSVHVQCAYVNEQKGRSWFDFDISHKGTVSWDVKTQASDGDNIAPGQFPNYAGLPANSPIYTANGASLDRGELVCFAVDIAGQNQIAYNHLSATSTVLDTINKFGARFNGWGFAALGPNASPAGDNTVQGPAGTLVLDGVGPNSYDACPAYNVTSFSSNNSTLGNLQTFDNNLAVASCDQDLRQDFLLHLTKLQFDVWNSHQASFGGSFMCVDSNANIGLDSENPYLVNPSNFNFSPGLNTPNGMYRVRGVASTQCTYGNVNSETIGILGLSTASIGGINAGIDEEAATTMHTAGASSGVVLWDPGVGSQFGKKK